MSYGRPAATRAAHSRPAWSGMALVVESMLLLVFLIGSLAVIMQLFAAATTRAQAGSQLAQAVALATDTAERFAASPTDVPQTQQQDSLRVQCQVEAQPTGAGTLYHATISVFDAQAAPADQPLYPLSTARYEGVG